MAREVDIRGRQVALRCRPVLLDPSGGRARVLAWTGRAIAVVFLLWLVGLAFAGLGLLPSGSVPLGRALVRQGPPPLRALPPAAQPELVGSVTSRPATATISRGASPSSTLAASTLGRGARRALGGTVGVRHQAGITPVSVTPPTAPAASGGTVPTAAGTGRGTAGSVAGQAGTGRRNRAPAFRRQHGHATARQPKSNASAASGSGVKRGQTHTTSTTTTTPSGSGPRRGRAVGQTNRNANLD